MRSCVQFTVTMDAKDLRTESALSERNNDGSKYSQSGGIAIHCDRNKSYQDIGSNSLPKVDVQGTRPCAVIGPDRVVPPPAPSDAYLKKVPVEPWPCMDNPYHTRRPPEYPHKLASFQNPTRNISPRQTFQENMQRIMVPTAYNSVKISDDTNYVQMSDRSNALPKNIKINVPPEAKFCDVPYTVYPNSNEQKNLRIPEMCIPNVNQTLSRTAPHGWPGSVNIRPTRTYGAPELYQYPDYSSCAGPRPVVPRPNRTVPDESGYVYGDPFYHQEGNIRFKPYPTVKERFPQQRYEYIGNYPNSFHPPPSFPPHKYELPKTVPPHPYPPYPPIKYMDRVPEPVMEGYQRNQQGGYNIPYRNQIIHPNYGPVLGNCPQNKMHSYPPEAHIKAVTPNKPPFDNGKAYIDYENGRPKMYPPSEGYLVNEMGKMHHIKSQVIMPNYPTLNMHNIPPNPYYKKDNQQIKNYEYIHFRNMDPNLNIHNPMIRHPPVFSPNTSAISPTDSSASNDTSQTLGNSQEDCGYVSQSSTASVRSMDSGINRIPNDCLRKYYDSRFGPIIRTTPMMSKSELNPNNNSKEKKNLDVRQFLQMWNEGDEETEENNPKDIIVQSCPKSDNAFGKSHEVINQPNQEQLYVLGLVNVPSEELGKYEHIQKVSKLPENIKGYNHIELLNQFEEAIEFSNMTNYKTSTPKDFQMSSNQIKAITPKQPTGIIPPRPLSPLDVEAKISQSVIHKEVGCNFEIKPCSPKMLNVEVATPAQNILAERSIEKVANPVMLKSPRINGIDENIDCNIMKRKDHRININNEPVRIPSCKMINAQFSNNIDSIKNSYSLQDLESNSGLCLASLPRLDNDIELNFPEVNQQFINANKGETSVSTSLRDLPSLELLDNSDSQSKDKLNDVNSMNPTHDILKSPCVVDSEKEFSKLSKYRKSKTHSSEPTENQSHHVMNAARTDSVIIKNPENSKNYEEKSIFSPNFMNSQIVDIQQVPINLTSQGHTVENVGNAPPNVKSHDTSEEKNIPLDIAIDFSLNKNSSNENLECIDKNRDTKIFTHNSTEINDSMLDDNLSKLSTFSDCNQNIPDSLTDNKIDNNSIPSPIKDDVEATVPEITKDRNYKENISLIEDPPLREILMKNECLSPTPGVKDTQDEVVSVPNTECETGTNDESNNSLLSLEFEAPDMEHLRTTNCGDDNYLMDIDKSTEIVDKKFDKVNTIIENSLDSDIKNDISIKANIANVQVLSEDGAEVRLDSELGVDGVEDNISQITNEDNSRCNNLDLKINEILHSDTSQNNNSKQKPDSQFDFPSSNNITHGQDESKENIDEDINFNSNVDKANDSSNDHQSEDMRQEIDSKMNTYSPNTIVSHSPQQTQSDTIQKEFDSDLLPAHNIRLDREENEGQVTEFNLASSNNMTSFSPKDSKLEDIKSECASDGYSLTHKSNNDTIETIDRKNAFNFEISNNVIGLDKEATRSEDPVDLLDEISDLQTVLPCTEKTRHKETSIQNEEGMIDGCRLKLSLKREEDKHVNGLRYLAYGSKEMYSPRIQKLVMYSEGNSKNVNLNNDINLSNNSLTETDQLEVSNNDDLCLEEVTNINAPKTDNSSNLFENDFNTPTIQNDDIAMSPKNNIVENEYSKVKIDSIQENMNVVNEKDIREADKLNNSNTDTENDEFNPLIDCTQSFEYIKNNETFKEFSIEDGDEKICDKLDTDSKQEQVTNLDVNQQSKFSGDTNEQYDSNDKVLKSWGKESYSNDQVLKQSDEQHSCVDEKSQLWDKQSCISEEVPEEWDNPSDYIDDQVANEWDGHLKCNDGISKRWDKQSNSSDEITEQWDGITNIDDTAPRELDKQSNCSNDEPEYLQKKYNCRDNVSEQWDEQPNFNVEIPEQSEEQSGCNELQLNTSTTVETDDYSFTKVQSTEHDFLNKNRKSLKRSLSDSALNIYSNNEQANQDKEENVQFIWPFKRRKINNIQNDILAQNLCNIIQSNRRNSISAMYNEENVSFCILIDNGCIIAEEENDEQEKICYTALPEECLAEIQDDCTKEESENLETVAEVVPSPEDENECEYSDSFVMQGEDEKIEESWVEDIACVETVISDDIAEDIEISGPATPKDDVLSDNDESGVFSSSEHTDKVKYIYGDKMCNDDAQFVETLYNTPQMNVNKTLVQRETLISGEYYDNDSLEKILSESNGPELSPYVSEYTEPVYSPGIMDVKETVENKENMDVEVVSPIQSKGTPLHIADVSIDNENIKLGQLFDETQDDTILSCESSVDNVFTYKENDENTNYTTSSSPEVSSTTSEEKNSSILLKITNYKGSRISQINDINRDSKRPSCKFTEDKDYVQSHSNFPTHRPLLTKAAQKYIPPLKESMRDLKVKLSLPQHSLMKLKQLKISKDEPKACKPNLSVPRLSKKPKPKFEDVLKSIDEIQIKMHKEKTKKSKKVIPKVVIKKNENGSHYASTSNKDEFNPDLTGRKWQPWVFIEKNHFIDKMAIKNKTKAIYSHRKRTYVLAEKFQKYKSVNSAKFVISPPISDCPSTGLKYTIRLKHNY